jgi:predicted butyrate kinase (DUF1464 family)
MHTWDKETYTFHFNSDFSGNIIIKNAIMDEELNIDGDILLEFIAENFIRPNKIGKIEQLEWKKLYKNQ